MDVFLLLFVLFVQVVLDHREQLLDLVLIFVFLFKSEHVLKQVVHIEVVLVGLQNRQQQNVA